MTYNSIVLVKQVPDTANIFGEVMKPDGTVNRAKLPTIFNPEDKVALEFALQVKDQYGGKVTAVTMGPPKAAELLKECLYMGADDVVLVTDRKFAGADTLATSYVLNKVIEKIGNFDIIFAGRQAIDGDTAQVGPQTAEKLGLPQITYTEKILELNNRHIKVQRLIDGGHEILRSELPLLLTVVKEASVPRPFSAKRVMTFKNHIPVQLTTEDLDIDLERCGLNGSPTKVYNIESVVLSAGDHETIEPTKEGLEKLIDKLMNDHIFG
ncbi:MAG: electron transfer flavoprotein subunit beta/FixA family protein [Candidatus Marinimicrobia bacterium]|nr:electron transfer flavoprotein subunit beta/FixA family protein [Candidatus Neomarinimicrobiota bacterium]